MANYDAETVTSAVEFATGAGRSAVPAGTASSTVFYALKVDRGAPDAEPEVYLGRRYFKFRAPCSNAPNGYVTWVNTTGNDEGRPACGGSLGASQLVETWVQ